MKKKIKITIYKVISEWNGILKENIYTRQEEVIKEIKYMLALGKDIQIQKIERIIEL